jgi:hypothetical protein
MQTFLDARAAALPPPRRPYHYPTADRTTEESRESQDEFAGLELELDLNDPDLLAALGDSADTTNPISVKEGRVCEVRHMRA